MKHLIGNLSCLIRQLSFVNSSKLGKWDLGTSKLGNEFRQSAQSVFGGQNYM